ncbi:extracellular solute-binding protein [Roseospira navarrensis]|uniref:Extracellular solute-binding protein n=1 Tax=Roseospira navarrensis TaxID=140058 RepID=A0A7X2D455_9PROT|nr:extracellular solute-binding protein [Roseospira navarrensis]MQX37583.1 extracellular solute-binding protein [Roseospira navarrensis]
MRPAAAGPSRRALLAGAVAVGGTAFARPVPGAPLVDPWGSPAAPLRVIGYDGQWPEALRAPLRDLHGLTLDVTTVPGPAEALARVKADAASAPFDVVVLGLEDVAAWRADGLLQAIGPGSGLVEALPDVVGAALAGQGGWDENEDEDEDGRLWLAPVGVGFDVLFAAGVGIKDAGLLAPTPPSWAALLAPDLKGRVTLEPVAAVWMGLALVDPERTRLAAAAKDKAAAALLFREVREALKPYRAQVKDLWTGAASFLAVLRGTEDAAGLAWDGLARRAEAERWAEPLAARVPSEGSVAWLDGLAIPATAAQPDAARRLMAALAAPELMAAWCAGSGGVPPVPGAWGALDPEHRAWMTRVLETDGGWSRLRFRPALGPAAAAAFEAARARVEAD